MIPYKSADNITVDVKPIDLTNITNNFLNLFRLGSLDEKTAKELYSFGYTLYQQDRFAEASIFFQYILLNSKLDTRNLMAIGACCQAQFDFETGALLYQLSMDCGETDPALHLYLGECLIRLGKETEAVAQFKLALELTRELPDKSDIYEKASGLITLVKNTDRS